MSGRIVSAIERLNRHVGYTVAWLTLIMVVVTFAIVVLRYALRIGPIWLQESLTWMHAAVFMLGGAFALQRDEHVRVDIFYRGMPQKWRAWIDIAGVLVFLLPLCVFIAYESYPYVAASWSIREGARDAGGLPYPFVSLLKSLLIVTPALVALQGVALLLKSIASIRGGRDAAPQQPGSA